MFCQVCGSRNPDDEEFCVRCQSKLLVLSGVGVVEAGRDAHEEIPFDEHLLERISTLEEVVKRTGDALKSLFESLGNLEKNLFVAHTGVLALQEMLERNGVIRAEEVRGLWETKLDERMQAVEKKDRFLERRDRIFGRFSGGNREQFTKRLREAEFALLALDADRGIRGLEELYKVDRSNTELGFYLAETFFSAGDMERASGYLKKVLAVQPNHFESLVYSGIVASEAGDTDAAETFHRRAIERRSDAFLPHFALGTLYAHASRWADAEKELLQAVEIAPQPSAHVLLGNVLREKGDVSRAILHFEEALKLQPDSEEAVFQLGLCHLEKNRLKRALECFHDALEKNPRKLEYQEAVRILERRKLYPLPNVEGPGADTYRRAEEAVSRGTLRRAHELYRQALTAEPENSTIRISYALLSASLGLWKEAIASCREVLSREPEEVVAAAACSILSESLRAEGRPSEAAHVVREFLDRHQSSTARAVGYYELATNLAESGEDLDSALDYAGRALAAAPEELKPYPLAALGWVHYKREEFDRAIECLRRSSERAAAPTTFHHLGLAYLAAGRPDEAKAAFHKAKTTARGGKLEDRVMQQVRSNLRLLEKTGPRKKAEAAPKAKVHSHK
ncbi:MAG TPA: tetratricopeptide repeat protein [Thermoanaerobaculia bacterium]|jgi:tetratricopeptide (TPR) repeat protein|nr:tetratricopeptide repeat protein [Thermoanaerobaculia bacterium]